MSSAVSTRQPVALGKDSIDVEAHTKFYWAMSALLLLIVLLGFSRSFFLRPFFEDQGVTFWWAYLHGTLMTAWYLFFFAQTTLVVIGRRDLHRKAGRVGAVVGVAALAGTAYASAVLLPTASEIGIDVTDDSSLPRAAELFWGNMGAVIVFAILLSLAIYFRKRPELHKRFMLFTFIATVTPAISRLTGPGILDLPGSSPVRNTVGIVLLAGVVVSYDLISRHRIHAATLICLLLFFAQRTVFSFAMPATDFGLAVARALRMNGAL